jgi:hypothetical protein
LKTVCQPISLSAIFGNFGIDGNFAVLFIRGEVLLSNVILPNKVK